MKVIAKHVIKEISPNKDRIFAILSRRLISDNVINHVELATPGIAFVMAKESAVLNNKPVTLNEYTHRPNVCRFIEAHSNAKGNAEVIEVLAVPMSDLSGRWTITISIQANSTYRNVWDNIIPIPRELGLHPKDFEILEFIGSETRRETGLWYLPKERFLLELAGQSNDGFAKALRAVDIAAEKINKEARPPRWVIEYRKLIEQGARSGSETCMSLHRYWTNTEKTAKVLAAAREYAELNPENVTSGPLEEVIKAGEIPDGVDLDTVESLLKVATDIRRSMKKEEASSPKAEADASKACSDLLKHWVVEAVPSNVMTTADECLGMIPPEATSGPLAMVIKIDPMPEGLDLKRLVEDIEASLRASCEAKKDEQQTD